MAEKSASQIGSELDDVLGDDDAKNKSEEDTTVEEENAEEGDTDSEEEEGETGEGEAGDETDEDDEDSDDDLEDDEDEEDVGGEGKAASQKAAQSLITKLKNDYKDIKRKYPQVIDAYFQAQEYKQVFASVDDARLASDKSDLLDQIAEASTSGDPEPLLDLVYESDKEGLKALVTNFMPTLFRKSPKLFTEAAQPIVDNVFNKLYINAKKNGNKNLGIAVQLCLKAMGANSIPDATDFTKVPEGRPVNERTNAVLQQAEQDFYTAIDDIVQPALEREIVAGLGPEDALPEGVREAIVERVKRRVFAKLREDGAHMRTMTTIKKSAQAARFNREYQKRAAREVVNAAKALIPSFRAKEKKRFNLANTGNDNTAKRIPNSGGEGKRVNTEAKVDYAKGESIADALNRVLPS